MLRIMKALARLFLLVLLLLNLGSCQSPYETIIKEDNDSYSILKDEAFLIVTSPYSLLKKGPQNQSKIIEILRKKTILKIIKVKYIKDINSISYKWYLAQDLESNKVGWMRNFESYPIQNIYQAQAISKELKPFTTKTMK